MTPNHTERDLILTGWALWDCEMRWTRPVKRKTHAEMWHRSLC